jgi:hypothetical protein
MEVSINQRQIGLRGDMPDAPLTFLVPNVRFFLSPNSSCKIFSAVSMEKPQKSDSNLSISKNHIMD